MAEGNRECEQEAEMVIGAQSREGEDEKADSQHSQCRPEGDASAGVGSSARTSSTT
jgi:hypothetical protein